MSGAQITYIWTGGTIGDYQVVTNWAPTRTTPNATDILAFDATADIAVVNVPNQTIGAIRLISGTATVSFATNVITNILSLSAATPLIYTTAGSILAADLLTISLTNTAAFTISSGRLGIVPSTGGKILISSDVILSGGTLDFDVVGTGGTNINPAGSITYNSGVFTSFNTTAITWAAGSDYYHAADGVSASAIPAAIWSTGATCHITGMNGGSVAPTGFTGATFANVTWNCTAQSGNVDLDFGGSPILITGTLSIVSTGGAVPAVRFSNAATVTVTTAIYTQTGGNLVLQSSTGSTVLTVANAFTQNGGTIDFAGSGASASTALLSLRANVTKTAGTWSSTSTNAASQMIVQFAGIAAQVVNIAGTWNAPLGGRCSISNTNTDATGVSLSASTTLSVYNTNSATAATCTSAGYFTGLGKIAYQNSGGFNNLKLLYNGTIPQTASAVEFPVTAGPVNLEISNTAGVSFPASFNRRVPGTFTMTIGNLNIGTGNTLSLSSPSLASQLVYTAGNITSGTLKRYFPAAGLPTAATSDARFPFGSGANDRSLYVYFSAATVTTGDSIAISHTAIVNASAIGPFTDNGVLLDKRTNSNWVINVGGGFNLGATTVSVQAQATNVGSVDDISTLRLTDAVAGFGTLIATMGTLDAPRVGKANLALVDINGKTLYVGSDATNALQIVTFTWTGLVNTSWTNAGNWTGGVGYPSAPTEIAIINTLGGNMPEIATGAAISVYQLTVAGPASLTITGTGSISVADNVVITGPVNFAPTSSFIYSSSNATQNILDLPYGALSVTGSAVKILPVTTTVKGDFSIATGATVPTFGTGTFIYTAGSVYQRVAAANYYNLTFTGDRAGGTIRLGNGISNNTIDIANDFVMTATNYVATDGGYNAMNFSSTSTTVAQNIPGFTYGIITNTGNGLRVYDPLGSADPAHVINCRLLGPSNLGGATLYDLNITTGSKVKLNLFKATDLFSFPYYDFDLSGNLGGGVLRIFPGQEIRIAGAFTFSSTNYIHNPSTGRFYYNGTGNQTITAFDYNELWTKGETGASGTRTVTLQNSGVIGIRNNFIITNPTSFSLGNGFVVTGSTVNFNVNSGGILPLTNVVAGGNNYHHINVNGGIRLVGGNLLVGGNVTVSGTDANPAQLTLGNDVSNRFITIDGNLSVAGTSSLSAVTASVDFNNVRRAVTLRLAGNLSITGNTQLLTGNAPLNVKGTIIFTGTNQQYTNTSLFKNKYVNYSIGDGTNPTILTLNDHLHLTRSGSKPESDSLTINNNATLNAGTKNITIGIDTLTGSHNASFRLLAGATFVTANTGTAPNTAIEGTAVDGASGSILAGTMIAKSYNTAASYVLNGATVNPFPPAITTMANLTIGANVSLNRAIDVNNTLDLAAFTLTQAGRDLEFSGLASTTGSIFADNASALSINGTLGTVGTLRFAVPGGNTTGQFTINRPITVPLGSDLIIEKTPLTGNFITGTATSILDIRVNTLTINGAVSGTGFLAGSDSAKLILGGTAGSVKFITGKQILKNLTLVNSATATLGTALDITGGTAPLNEGTVSVTGTALLTTGGNLTLKSNANGTARVAPGSGTGGYISGDVSVERFLSGIRSWRFLAAPTYGQTIKQSWQENQAAGVNPGTGYGTNITSNSASWLANGFDFQTPGNSLLTYNVVANGWQGVPNTALPISAAGDNKSYMVFLRGDRSVTPAPGVPGSSAVVRTKGSIFQGNLPAVPVPTAGQFAAIGNNYASAIDFTTLSKTNIDQSFSVWDPKAPGALNLGAWVSFSAATPTPWAPVPGGGSYPAGVANTRIESGQAFMVHSTAGSGSVTLNESSKLSGSRLVSRPVGTNAVKRGITTNLYNLSSGQPLIADGNVVVFCEDYATAVDEHDAVKPNNFGDNFGITQNNQLLVVDARQPATELDTVFFYMKKIKLLPYRLELIGYNFDPVLVGFLEDSYLHTTTTLNLLGTTTYDFIVTGEAASAAANRFRIVFKNSAPLPVSFTSIAAAKKANGNEVEWKVDNEINISSYEVERSIDGINFTKTGAVAAGGNAVYNWLDAYPVNGDNFYRVKSISNRGTVQFSRIVKVTAVKGKTGFTVYPNPSTDGNIGLQMSNLPAGIYSIRLMNESGQVIAKELINHAGGTATNVIHGASVLVSGNYQVEIIDITGKSTVIKVLVL